MDDFSLWTEAGRDAEAEAATARLARAKVAAAGVWPFVAIAESEAEFGHRLALAEPTLAGRVEADLIESVKTALLEDFRAMRSVAYGDGPTRDVEPYYHGQSGFRDGVGSYSHHDEDKTPHYKWKPHAVYDSLGSAVNHLAGGMGGDGISEHLEGYNHCNSCDHVYTTNHDGAHVSEGPDKGKDRCLNCGTVDFHDSASDVMNESREPYDEHGPDYHGLDGDNYGDPYGRHDHNFREYSKQASGSQWCDDCGARIDSKGLCPSCVPDSERNEDERSGEDARGRTYESSLHTAAPGEWREAGPDGSHGHVRKTDDGYAQARDNTGHITDHPNPLRAKEYLHDKATWGEVEKRRAPSYAAADPQNRYEPTKHVGHDQSDVCTSACFTPRAVKGDERLASRHEAAFWHEYHDPETGRTYLQKADGMTHGEWQRAQEHPHFVREFQGDKFGRDYSQKNSALQVQAEYFDHGLQRWVKVAAPPGDGVPEQGPNTSQTGFPPLATDPINPINQMFPMQPSPWPLSPEVPTEVTNAATGEQVPLLQPSKASRLPFVQAADGNPFDPGNNPFSGGSGFSDMGGGVTPQTTPPRQIPGGTGGGFETGQGVGDVTDESPSDDAAKNPPPPPSTVAARAEAGAGDWASFLPTDDESAAWHAARDRHYQRGVDLANKGVTYGHEEFESAHAEAKEDSADRDFRQGHSRQRMVKRIQQERAATAGVVRERPTNDNPNGVPDEFISNNFDAPLKLAPRQSPEDRGINSPTLPDDTPIPENASDIPRPGDNEETEAGEKSTRVRQGFSARENGRTMGIPVICHGCKQTGVVERVTASLTCRCGSQDLDLWEEPWSPAPGRLAALETTFIDYMRQSIAGQGPNPMSNGKPVPFPCGSCKGTGQSRIDGICRYCNGTGKVGHYGAEDRAPAVASRHEGSAPTDCAVCGGRLYSEQGKGWKHVNQPQDRHEPKTAAPRGKRPKQNGEFDVEQLLRDTTRGYGDRKPENETVRPGTKRKDTIMGVTPAYRPHFDYDHTEPKAPFETGHRCPSCGHGVTYLSPDYKGDSWLTCPKEGPLINVDRGQGTTFDPENPPENWAPSARSFKAPEKKTAGVRKKPKALQIAEGIVATNPGIRPLAAYRIAQRTIERFPAVAGR